MICSVLPGFASFIFVTVGNKDLLAILFYLSVRLTRLKLAVAIYARASLEERIQRGVERRHGETVREKERADGREALRHKAKGKNGERQTLHRALPNTAIM